MLELSFYDKATINTLTVNNMRFLFNVGDIHHCRDVLLKRQKKNPSLRLKDAIPVAMHPEAFDNVLSFINLIEDRMNLPLTISEDIEVSHLMGKARVFMLYPSKEWMKTPMRASAFSLLVKVGMQFKTQRLRRNNLDTFLNRKESKFPAEAYYGDSVQWPNASKKIRGLLEYGFDCLEKFTWKGKWEPSNVGILYTQLIIPKRNPELLLPHWTHAIPLDDLL